MTVTPRFSLPLLAAAQAQKHVTHNEALIQADALASARLLSRGLTAPPASPTDGDTYLVAAGATGAWSGHSGEIAHLVDGAWRFYEPFQGLTAYVADEPALIVFDGAAWTQAALLTSGQAALGTDLDIVNANQFYDGPGLALAVGTWLVIAQLTAGRTNTTLIHYTAKLWDGTTVWASTEQTHPSLNPHYVNLTLAAVVVLAAPATVKASVAATTGGCLIKAAVPDNGTGAGNTASQLCAIRIK